jgi:5-bromo-4-chloroindolyl phosphate hydrolysis protein
MNKCEKLSRILRSAVGGKNRSLTLIFEVHDELDVKSKIYKIIHKTPQEVLLLEDNKTVTWRYLKDAC